MEAIGRTYFKVLYNNKDITNDISEYLTSIRYNDKTGDAADEIQLTVENSGALWENEWYPEKGAKLSAKIGDKDFMLDCGEFEIDEIEIESPPDVVTIRAISSGIKGALRTLKSKAHENTTLKSIVDQVAADNKLTVKGVIPIIQLERVTQNRETDLQFLRRLADKFGFMYSIRGTDITFTDMVGVIAANPVAVVDRSQCSSYKIKDKGAKVFRKAKVAVFSPVKKSVVTFNVAPVKQIREDGTEFETIAPLSVYYDKAKKEQKHAAYLSKYPNAPADYENYYETMTLPEYVKMINEQRMQAAASGVPDLNPGIGWEASLSDDQLNIYEGIENESNAEIIANSALIKNATNQQEGNITLKGDPILVAGVNFEFTGIGKLSGKYHIEESEHSLDKESGYKCTLSIKRVGFIELTKHKRKVVKKPTSYDVTVIR